MPPRPRRYQAFGARLKELRTAARLRQGELATLLGVSYSWPSRMEVGIDRPDRHQLQRIVKVLRDYGAPADYDELAVLADYADELPTHLVPVEDEAKVPVARRLLRLPLAALLALEDIAARLHLEAYEEPEPAHQPNQPRTAKPATKTTT